LASALVAFLFVGEVVILAAFGGLVNPPPGLRASLISGLLGIGFFLVLITIGVILVFAPCEAQRLTFPTFALARVVSLGEFLERIESLFIAIWVGSVCLKIALFLYVTSLGLATVAGLKEYRPLVPFLGALNIAISNLWFKNIITLRNLHFLVFPGWALVVYFLLPWFLLLVACWKGERRTGI